MQSLQSQLLAEIEFWEDMITRPDRPRSAEMLERMELALSLARRKLERLDPQEPERATAPAAMNPHRKH